MSGDARSFVSLEELHAARLKVYRNMLHREVAVAAALDYCDENALDAPPWLVSEAAGLLCNLLNPKRPGKRGRAAGALARYRQDMIDYARWDQVKVVREKQTEIRQQVEELRAAPRIPAHILSERQKMLGWVGRTWLRAFECASMLLQGTNAHGGPDAIKASYLRVKRNSRNSTFRYHIVHPGISRRLEISEQLKPRRGTKIGALYDLTL